MYFKRVAFRLFDTFRQEMWKAIPFTSRQLHNGNVPQRLFSEQVINGCKNLRLLEVIKSKVNYVPVQHLSHLAGRSMSILGISGQSSVYSLSNRSSISNYMQSNGVWGHTSIRTNVRCHFPRPCEKKRIKTHGYKKRMSTPAGRRIIMRRLLKGRYVLSH